MALIGVVGTALGVSVIILVAIVRERAEFRRLGYRARWIAGDQYVYEEQSVEAPIRPDPWWRAFAEAWSLVPRRRDENVRHVVFRCDRGDPGRTIQIPEQLPPWACGRREEIVARVTAELD